MTANEIRKHFLDFFASKEHKIVPSAPIVNKNDPTLMFTNAGMNQFKDYFLGDKTPEVRRLADTQKCLRVSGKHNDLDEVGRDGYHHTMFEMLGNWSIGDYFKDEAIAWAWELLTDVYKLDKDRLYVSVFEGDKKDGLEPDLEAVELWKRFIPEDRILFYDRKDNFWEMGETGPCGPCSEIHIDLRSDEERAKVDGKTLVNADDPQVVEIWNLVFIQFNRKADGSLEELPEKHIDTGMGFERLCMAMQQKGASYATDIFTPFIEILEKESGKKYGFSYAADAHSDMAMRVVVDHIRAVAFTIADGQLPSSNGAGYVIRRILRRAVRYYYSFLGIQEPLLFKLLPLLADRFQDVFPELKAQEEQIVKIIKSEENAFLQTLERGLTRIEEMQPAGNQIAGKDAFELYDTFGFPFDLTQLIAEEKGWTVDEAGYQVALEEQKARSRADAQKQVGDWVDLRKGEVEFVGYDESSVPDAKVLKYRTVQVKKKEEYQIVLNKTPFYAESGGQAGDTGLLWFGEEKIPVIDTQKENDLIIHIVKKFPSAFDGEVRAEINEGKRQATSQNHSAVHLMHAALHEIVGEHALQKGQDVNDKRLRFDFSHFQRMEEQELEQLEEMVNAKIRANIQLEEDRAMPIEAAKEAGAMMLFGEKYGDVVRMITFDADFSRELCGGTHVPATAEIGQFKILSESAVAAGVRRIEAVTGQEAQAYIKKELDELAEIRGLFKNAQNTAKSVAALQEENRALKKQVEQLQNAQAAALKGELKNQVEDLGKVHFLGAQIPLGDSNAIKNLAFQLEKELPNTVIVLAAEVKGKPQITIIMQKDVAEQHGLNAGQMVRELGKLVRGGGGGQAFYATAGGSDVSGLDQVIPAAKELVRQY
ncbi:MAG: alanine--tRNA ligase [Bacteroidota bacterium]